MNSLAFRLKDLGKTQNFSLKMLCLSLTICMVAIGTFSFAATPTGDSYIKFSTNANLTNAAQLDGATVSGNIYVHLADSKNSAFTYSINGVLHNGMRSFPQHMEYLSSDRSTPNAFDTTTLNEGPNTISVSVWNSATRISTVHVSKFTVDNIPDRKIDSYIRVSAFSDRSQDGSLDGAIVKGKIYIFLADKANNAFTYSINGVKHKGMTSFPQDMEYLSSDRKTPNAFDTNILKNGKNEISVLVWNSTTRTSTQHVATFTVNNAGVVPTQPPATQPPVTTPSVFTPAFAGDVAPGKVRWGSSIGGNGDPVARHGAELANRMGVRRTFWDMNKTSSLVATAKADLAAGRLPWVSVKLNGNWKSNGDGVYDAQMTKLLTELSALNGPVWFTVHHEPEGGASVPGVDDPGGAKEWIRVQENTSKLLKQLRAQGKANNIGFASILMGWTWDSRSGRNPADWFKAGIWDFAGIDAYGEGEGTTPYMQTNGMAAARLFYGARGLKVAVGEWGIRNQNHQETTAGEIPTAQEQADALNRFNSAYTGALGSATDGKGAQVIGLSYFDSSLNSPSGSWELTYLQLPRFRELVKAPTSLQANQFK